MLGNAYGAVAVYACLVGLFGWWLAGRRWATPLADRAVEQRGVLLTVALGGLTVGFVALVFLADKWAAVDTGTGLFYPRGLAASLQIVLYSLRVAMGALAVTFLGAFASPGRARSAAAVGCAVAALAMVAALPAVLVLVFEIVDGARGAGT